MNRFKRNIDSLAQAPFLSSGKVWTMRFFALPFALLFSFSLAFGQTTYYSKSAGNLNLLTTWGVAIDGSGANPPNFTDNNQIFNVWNNTAPTIGANWVVSGTGSRVNVGDGVNPCVVSVGAGVLFTISSGVTLDFGASDYLTGAGDFTLSGGSTLRTANPAGYNGSIQNTGTKLVGGSVNYVFYGVVPQVTGAGLPGTMNNITIDNPSGVTLSKASTINGAFSSNGQFSTAFNIS